MNKNYGSQSMVAPMKRVIVRKPDEAFGNADPGKWHYTNKPDLKKAIKEHEYIVDLLENAGVEVIFHEINLPDHADAIYVHDPVLISDKGAILLRMGKSLRRGEETAIGKTLEKAGIPIHYRLNGEALAEGGDLLWVDEKTLAVGLGYRTNIEGMGQLAEALPDVEMIPVQLPYYQGPEACLHLMSTVSLVDHELAVVYKPLTSVLFLQELERRGFRMVEVPEEEFLSMGPNVLAIGPSQCLMLEGNLITQGRLAAEGCEVVTYKGDEISLKAEGGATCLTRPVWRGY